jgi:uncharacterized protein (TIGR04222 family)
MDDTWGMSGPAFLWYYGILAIIAVAGVLIWRRQFTGPALKNADRLEPSQVAYVNGGDELAVYASLAGLRAVGAIESQSGYLRQSGPVPSGAGDLDRALHDASGRKITLRSAMIQSGVRRALDRTRDDLIKWGWILDDTTRHRIRRASATVGFSLVALGVLRAFVGRANERPIGYLVILLIPITIAAFLLLRVPRQTAGARQFLAEQRRKQRHLQPQMAPSWATYGAAGAAMGVGLFGAASLWAADPSFAQEAEIRRQATNQTAYGGDSDGGGDSGGGDGGGGGGGCGGGCGGCGG